MKVREGFLEVWASQLAKTSMEEEKYGSIAYLQTQKIGTPKHRRNLVGHWVTGKVTGIESGEIGGD